MFASTDCVLVLGTRGCGKSYLSKKCQEAWSRIFIYDTVMEYTDDDGFIVRDFNSFCEFLKSNESSDSFVLIYQASPEDSDEQEIIFNQIMRVCYYTGNMLIVIDEVVNVSSPHNLPKWLKENYLTGRHQNIAVMATTQRPGELHKTILSQSNHIFCGRIVETNDLNYVKSFLNKPKEDLANLPDREFFYKNKTSVTKINT